SPTSPLPGFTTSPRTKGGGSQTLLGATLDRMVDDWFKFVSGDLTDLLQLEAAIPTRVRLKVSALSAALPFELAPNLLSCEMLSRVADPAVTNDFEPAALSRLAAVRIVRPAAVE